MTWKHKWRDALSTGQYYVLFNRGFFDNKPEDLPVEVTGFEYYLDAFEELSTTRPVGMGLEAISFTAMIEYFKIYPTDDFFEYHYVLRRMDNVYRNLVTNEKKPSPTPAKGENGNSKQSNKRNKSPVQRRGR